MEGYHGSHEMDFCILGGNFTNFMRFFIYASRQGKSRVEEEGNIVHAITLYECGRSKMSLMSKAQSVQSF